MSLVFAGITPHPPLLLPTIGKEKAEQLVKTKEAFAKMEEDLYLSRPDILIIFTLLPNPSPDALTLNVSPEYTTNLKAFGDLTTQVKFKGEIDLASMIREQTKTEGPRTIMTSDGELDYRSSIPLVSIAAHLPQITILPIGYAPDLDWKTHFNFGATIKEQIMNTNKRVAVIASVNLSHALTTESPAGFHPSGPEFDAKLQELLTTKNTAGLMMLDPHMATDAAEAGFPAILMLLGVLNNLDYSYKNYTYEAPFGVGYLTSNFVI